MKNNASRSDYMIAKWKNTPEQVHWRHTNPEYQRIRVVRVAWQAYGVYCTVSLGVEIYQEIAIARQMHLASQLQAADSIKVIGRLQQDTDIANNWPGYEVLNDPNWTLGKNEAWTQMGIKNRQIFYTASPVIEKNLVSSNPLYPGKMVFARELGMLSEAEYIRIKDYLIPPVFTDF